MLQRFLEQHCLMILPFILKTGDHSNKLLELGHRVAHFLLIRTLTFGSAEERRWQVAPQSQVRGERREGLFCGPQDLVLQGALETTISCPFTGEALKSSGHRAAEGPHLPGAQERGGGVSMQPDELGIILPVQGMLVRETGHHRETTGCPAGLRCLNCSSKDATETSAEL
jgi:hypothetical protein